LEEAHEPTTLAEETSEAGVPTVAGVMTLADKRQLLSKELADCGYFNEPKSWLANRQLALRLD